MSTRSRRWTGRGSKLGSQIAKRKRDRIRRRLQAEHLERRELLAGDVDLNPYHNYSFNVDVDENWQATPRDVLLIVNSMESQGMGPLGGDDGEGEVSASSSDAYKFDTNNDGNLSPADVLRVVNFINSGEGEPGDLVEFRLVPFALDGTFLPNWTPPQLIQTSPGVFEWQEGNPGTVAKDEDFLLGVLVEDIRTTPTGVFSAYLDVDYDNRDLHSVVFSETQQVTLPTERLDNGTPDDDDDDFFRPLGGSFTLNYSGETTGSIDLDSYGMGTEVTGLNAVQVGGAIASEFDQFMSIGFPGITQANQGVVNAGVSASPANPDADTILIDNNSQLINRGEEFRVQIGNELMWVLDIVVTDPIFPGAPDPPDEMMVMRGHAGTTIEAHGASASIDFVEGNIEVKRVDQFNDSQLVSNPLNYDIKFVNDFFEQNVSQICSPGGIITDVDNRDVCTATVSSLVTTLPKTVTVTEIARGVADDAEAFRRSFNTGLDYPNGQNAEDGEFDEDTGEFNPNVYSEAGSFADSISPLGAGVRILWLLRINADDAGTVTYQGSSAENQSLRGVQVYGSNQAIPPDMIEFGGPISVTIVEDITAVDDFFIDDDSVDEDSTDNPLDVLANDSTVEGSLSITSVTNFSNGGSANITNGGTLLEYTPADDFYGEETFEYEVTNGLGAFSSAMVTVNVFDINDEPTAINDFKTTSENTQLVFNLTDLIDGSASPGSEPDVVGPAVPAPNEVADQAFVDFTFAAGSQGGTIDIDQMSTPDDLTDDVVTYDPPAGVTGTETFTYTITDDGTTRGDPDPLFDTAVLTITITEVNDPPVAVDDPAAGQESNFAGDEDEPLDIDTDFMLINDNAGDAGQTISVTSVSSSSAEGGSVFLNDNGTPNNPSDDFVTYTPPDDYFGTDTFTYQITDDGVPPLTSTPATVTITLANVNDPPEAVDDLNIPVDEMSSAADNPIHVMANDNPGPNEELVDFIGIQSFTQGANGTVALDDNDTPGDVTDDFLTYEPDSNFLDGSDTFTYTIVDSGGLTDEATVTVNVVPVIRPRAIDDNNEFTVMDEGDPSLTINVLFNDLPNPNEQVTLLSVTDGTHGTVSIDDGGTAGDLTDDQVIYTPTDPNLNFYGVDTFTYTINDTAGTGDDSTATVTVTVNPVNDAPTLAVPGSQNVDEDNTLTISGISVGDIDSQQEAAPDPFEMQVTLSVSNGDLTLATTSGLTFLSGNDGQSSMSFRGSIDDLNDALLTVDYDPDPFFNGSDTLNVDVNDLGNVGDIALNTPGSVAITVEAVNNAPVLTAPGSQTTVRDTDLVFSSANANQISVFDVDSDPLNVEVALSVTNGILTLSTTTGISFESGSDGSAAMTIRGTQDDLNSALNGLTYSPTPAFSGSADLSIDIDDLGNTGKGPDGTDSDSVAITVENFINSDLSGYAYLDENYNRVVDEGELMLAGVEVTLRGTSILNAPVLETTTTDSDGNYNFFNVPPGEYEIQLGHVAYMIDAGETAGGQGGDVNDDEDLIFNITLDRFGTEDGSGNNFGKLGLRAQYLTIIDLFASSTDYGMLFGTDVHGNQFWQSILKGWEGVTHSSATLSEDLSEVTIRINTEQNGMQERTFSTRDPHVRAVLDDEGGSVIRLDATPEDMGFNLSVAEPGEGEAPAANPQAPQHVAPEEMQAEQYAAAVDELLAQMNLG